MTYRIGNVGKGCKSQYYDGQLLHIGRYLTVLVIQKVLVSVWLIRVLNGRLNTTRWCRHFRQRNIHLNCTKQVWIKPCLFYLKVFLRNNKYWANAVVLNTFGIKINKSIFFCLVSKKYDFYNMYYWISFMFVIFMQIMWFLRWMLIDHNSAFRYRYE